MPIRPFQLPGVLAVGPAVASIAARHSLVVVLPKLPVMATNVVRNNSVRQTNANAHTGRLPMIEKIRLWSSMKDRIVLRMVLNILAIAPARPFPTSQRHRIQFM